MEENFWNAFETSGKIEDYLRYKGIQHIDGKIKTGGINEATESKGHSDQGSSV